MKNKFKLHAPMLSIVLSLLAVGYSFAANVVVIPLGADETPSGMVSAFNSKECPAGWQYYEKAEYRFIRGMHPTSTPGYQAGTSRHNHPWSVWSHSNARFVTYDNAGNLLLLVDWGDGMDSAGSGYFPLALDNPTGSESYYTGNTSHTPEYVQLLYCEKV